MKFSYIFAMVMAMILPYVLSAAVPKKHHTDNGDIITGGSFSFCSVLDASCNGKHTDVGGHTKDANVTTPDTPQFHHAMANLSSLFGWQMAGSAISNNQLDATCNNIADTGHYKWVGESLVPAHIQEPICNVSNMRLDPSRAIPYIVEYSTNLFITQLLNSFAVDDETSLATLCRLVPLVKLENLLIQTESVAEAICSAAGLTQSPQPISAQQIPLHAATAYTNMASILYGKIYASAAINDAQVNVNCAHAPDFHSSLTAIKLNATQVEYTICQVATPMTTEEGMNAIKKYSSSTFVTIMENLGPQHATYFLWLCKALDVNAMNLVGMDGAAVRAQICHDAWSS